MMHDQETVLLQGHIIDSLILAKVLDTILMMGGTFDLQDMQIGKTREEPSRARIVVRASSSKLLSEILHAIQPHGASVESERDCWLSAAPANGIFPDEFYATTHLPTQVRVRDQWVEVEGIEMDLGILVDPVRLIAKTVPMGEVKRGDLIVTGREGVRVIPLQRPRDRDVFSFMESQVSSERPHGRIIGDIAKRLDAAANRIPGGESGQQGAAGWRPGDCSRRRARGADMAD